MTILKCIGAGAIVSGALLAAGHYRKSLVAVGKRLDATEQSLHYLEGRIALSEKMLCDVMKECGEKFFSNEKEDGGIDDNVFSRFAEELEKGGCVDVGEAWRKSVAADESEEAECLLRLEAAFSLSDVERYSESFKLAASEIKRLREAAEVRRKKDGDTAIKLCLCGAVAAVILLW